MSVFPGSRGFTLLEILFVLLLMGIVTSMVLPRLNTNASLESATRPFIGVIRSLQLAASSTKHVHRLHLDLDTHTYWATVVVQGKEQPPMTSSLARTWALPHPIRFHRLSGLKKGSTPDGQAVISFWPTGRTDATRVQLVDDQQEVLTLHIHSLVGRVTVVPGHIPLEDHFGIPNQIRTLLRPRSHV